MGSSLYSREAFSVFGDRQIDYSCKGAVLEELREGNRKILTDEESIRLDVFDGNSGDPRDRIAACFSRNI
jgi:hypothetical protein